MDALSSLQDILAWVMFMVPIWVPLVSGALFAGLAAPRTLRIGLITTAVLAAACLVEFFFPLEAGGFTWWFRSIFYFFGCLIFVIGVLTGIAFKTYDELKKQ